MNLFERLIGSAPPSKAEPLPPEAWRQLSSNEVFETYAIALEMLEALEAGKLSKEDMRDRSDLPEAAWKKMEYMKTQPDLRRLVERLRKEQTGKAA